MKCDILHNDTQHDGACAVMLNVANKPFMLSVIMVNVVMVSVIMLNVAATTFLLINIRRFANTTHELSMGGLNLF
jgi:hypothetical protein